ncbi:MAG: ABC transporter ATP-binding protein [Alphaproteobacteria bacterium]|nr:ABC transporter ATP-binding protein [Alphaproteobacteria bacterium]
MAASPAPTLAIEARGLSRVLPGPVPVTLVDDVSLGIAKGEMVAITGASGSGKSSLLYLLGLLDTPTGGSVWIDGRDMARLPPAEMAAVRLARLGFVFQFHFLLPEFSVLDNVTLPIRKLGRLSAGEVQARGEALLVDLGLADHMRKFPDQLSGGQRQRVAIARALANDPLIVLADEPTGNLDSRNARAVFDIFIRLAHEHKCALAIVTHEHNLADLADRRLVMADGRLEA